MEVMAGMTGMDRRYNSYESYELRINCANLKQ